MKPDLLGVGAVDLRYDELDVLGDQLALLPSYWFTGFVSCPDLLPIGIGLPESYTVLLRHISALRQHLYVRDHLTSLKFNVGHYVKQA